MATNLVHLENGQPITTSTQIAEIFDKRHDNILRSIENLKAQLDQEFNQLNFEGVKYFDAKGEERTYYNLTRDAFTLLAMGFTGAKALQFKLAFLNAFNQMENALHHQNESRQQLVFDLKTKILEQDPRLFKIIRLKHAGFFHAEIAKMVDMSASWVDRRVIELKKLDLLERDQPAQMILGV